MQVKVVRFYVTPKQHTALKKAARAANLSMSEFVRACLVQSGAIEYEEIERGGYRERRKKKPNKDT